MSMDTFLMNKTVWGFLFMLYSCMAFAIVLENKIFPAQKDHLEPKQSNRIVITGKPVSLNVHNGFFSFPDSYTIQRSYHFVTYLDTARVCFLHHQLELEGLERVEIIIADQGKEVRWECYKYDPRYFEIDY